jgi:TonB-dependent SusC/RagA subfamily outer membrane receptor
MEPVDINEVLRMRSRSTAALLTLALLWAVPMQAATVAGETLLLQQATTGRISGIVTDAATGAPVEAAQVLVAGTTIGGTTNQQGRYTLQSVPVGTVTLIVRRIGYAEGGRANLAVTAGGTTTADFRLTTAVRTLNEVVVTGTAGGTQKRAIGNVVATVNADSIMAVAPVGNINQLVGQRTPGVMMLPSTGQVGTGAAIRIRGNSSLSLSNEPIVYIDGVRMESGANRGPGQRGGANVSALNDVHPEDIESIEIIKGPAAATLYGTEASNGVIQIITKRGTTGAPQFDVSLRSGTNWLWNPEGRLGMRYMPDPNNPGQLIGFNAYRNELDRPGGGPVFGYGQLQSYSLNVRGGTNAVRYFASATRNDDVGVVDWNWDKQNALRANLEMELSSRLQMKLATSYNAGQTRLAQGSIGTDPFSNLVWSNPRFLSDARRGFSDAPPEEWGEVESRFDNDRTTTSAELRYQPVSWSTHRLVAGFDLNSEVSSTLYPQQPEGASHFYGQLSLGDKNVSRGARRVLTLDYSGSAILPWSDYVFTPSVGFQYYKTRSTFIGARGSNFPAVPITSVSGGSVKDASETFVENATAGVYFQQQVGWKNRLFLTGALRADANSAFGEEFKAAYYPKLSASWVVTEEPFFNVGWVDELRLRGAWGAAGQQPATFAAARLYSPTVGYQNQPSLLPAAFGNPELKPERGEELELGFDVTVFDGRFDVGFTRYQRAVKDAIVNRPLAPSSGFTGSQIVNIGLLNAWGNELSVNTRILSGQRFGWTVGTQFSTMRNEIKDLGGLSSISNGTQSYHREGYSIADLFMRRIVSAKLDAAGTVIPAETLCDSGTGEGNLQPGGSLVPCAQAGQVFLGHSQPTWTFGFDNNFTLFSKLRLYARLEGNGGHKQVNTEIRATHNQSTTEAVLLKNNPLLSATRIYENDRTGVYEAGFLRLRELSATYDLPDAFAARVGARRGSISLGMRNVAMLWTAQHGWDTPRDGSVREGLANMIVWDPEVRAVGQAEVGYQTVMPPTASATVALRFSF